jgi:hypothetical protein
LSPVPLPSCPLKSWYQGLDGHDQKVYSQWNKQHHRESAKMGTLDDLRDRIDSGKLPDACYICGDYLDGGDDDLSLAGTLVHRWHTASEIAKARDYLGLTTRRGSTPIERTCGAGLEDTLYNHANPENY